MTLLEKLQKLENDGYGRLFYILYSGILVLEFIYVLIEQLKGNTVPFLHCVILIGGTLITAIVLKTLYEILTTCLIKFHKGAKISKEE